MGALIHLAQDGVGRIGAIGQDNAGGGSQPLLFVSSQRGNRIAIFKQRRRQRPCIENSLPCAIGAARHHRMGGIAKQRHPPETPAGQRVLIDHRKFQHAVGGANERWYV